MVETGGLEKRSGQSAALLFNHSRYALIHRFGAFWAALGR